MKLWTRAGRYPCVHMCVLPRENMFALGQLHAMLGELVLFDPSHQSSWINTFWILDGLSSMYVVCLTLYVLFLKMFGSQYFCSSSFSESSLKRKFILFSSPCSHLFVTNINLVAKIMLAIVAAWLVRNGPAAIVVFLQTFARDKLCNITFIPVST